MEIIVSSNTITAMGVAMGICYGVPAVFVIANRHKMLLLPVVIGIVSWIVFAYFAAGMLVGTLFPGDSVTQKALGAVLQSFIMIIGHFLLLKYVSKVKDLPGAALSYGLGYSFVELVLIRGMELFSEISLSTAINNNGFEKVAETVEDPDALYDLIRTIAEKPVYEHLLGAAEILFLYLLTMAVSVFVWYSVRNSNYALAAVAFLLQTVCLASVLLTSVIPVAAAECVYGAAAAASAVFAFRLYRANEGKPNVSADPVDRFRF